MSVHPLLPSEGPAVQKPSTWRAPREATSVPPVAAAMRKRCSCGHEKVAHQHYRAGSDCALCECRRFHKRFLRG